MVKLTKEEKEVWFRYKIPGCSNLHRVKINVIHLSIANSKEHEIAKCAMAYDLMKQGFKILTEAQETKGDLRRDLVDITNGGEIYEFEDSSMKRGHRHPKNINVFWYDLNRMRTREEAENDATNKS